MPEPLLKPHIFRNSDTPQFPWALDVPDQGEAHSTREIFASFADAVAGLADWWANGNRASFLRYLGAGIDRRREAWEFITTGKRRWQWQDGVRR
jgi:hypothetical protein